MSKSRESHKQALRQLLDRYIDDLGCTVNKQKILATLRAQLVDEILRINDRFNNNPSLDEALNSGDGSYKP